MTKQETLLNIAPYLNMRVICEKANISYQTWRNFKAGQQRISDASCDRIIKVVEDVLNEVKF